MGSLANDLDRFLKTDGLRILIESGAVRIEPYEPLTMDDIDGFAAMDLGNLDDDRLEDLLDRAEDLRDELEDEEPDDEEAEEHGLWESRLSETEDFIDRVRDRLGEMEDKNAEEGEAEDAGTGTERFDWKNSAK